jgi:hypothetical protein
VGIIVNITSNGVRTSGLQTQHQVELKQIESKLVATINERQCKTKKMAWKKKCTI